MPLTAAEAALAASLRYPLAFPYGELAKCHACFNRVRMEENEALYEGGQLFEAQLALGKFLIKRESEKGNKAAAMLDLQLENPVAGQAARYNPNVGGNTYEMRKKYVSYTQRVAGLINFIMASVLSSAPVIVATREGAPSAGLFDKLLGFFGLRKTPSADPGIQFYHNLNTNADGRGASLLACKGKYMRDLAVHRRAFAGIAFPQTPAGNALEHRAAGGNNGVLTYFPAMECDDWEFDANGLCMVRRHFFTKERTVPIGQPDTKFENWVFMTAAGLLTYKIQWKADDEKPDEKTPVELVSVQPNTLKKATSDALEMPVRMEELGIHIMERLRPSAIDQVNLKCDLRWMIQRVVYALQVFFTKCDLNSVDPDTMAMKLDPNDKTSVESGNPAILEPLFKALERNDDEMYEALMALILKSAAQPSNGRQSGEAKRMDFNTFETFLLVFSEPLRQVLQWQIDVIKKQRGDDDILVAVQGLDNFDIESVTQILADSKELLGLPGIPKTARQATLLRAIRAVLGSNATPEQLEQMVKEIAADDSAGLPAPAAAPNALPAPTAKAAA